ncbi:MAG TPA: SCO1664 family protein [Jiangellaceae bacterium]
MDTLALLREGELTVDGRLTVASNLTLVGEVALGDERLRCVYKPIAGESPLWDFSDGSLAGREVAAYELSVAAGWDVVPPTVLRADGPMGSGMCQAWIDQPDEVRAWVDVVGLDDVPDGWLPILEAIDGDGAPVVLVHADDPLLRRLALFDVVVNNADRKGGHVLTQVSSAAGIVGGVGDAGDPGDAGGPAGVVGVVGVDHGVSFHTDPKLRTVLWGWAGDELNAGELDRLDALRSTLGGALGERLGELISADEVEATARRVDDLTTSGRLPVPTGRMPVPWPLF